MNKLARPIIRNSQRGLWGSTGSFSSDIGKNKDDLIYKLQFHTVKPDRVEDYIKLAERHVADINANQDIPQELVGSFRVWVGQQDEIVHIWKYNGGYAALDEAVKATKNEWNEYRAERATMLRQRTNQLLVQFAYMPDPEPILSKNENNVYELRSYKLKSGTQGEWSYSWNNIGMKCRQKNEAVTGLFTNAGPLNIVHHIWRYDSMKDRELARKSLWEYDDWSRHVRNTTPLIMDHESRILHPLPFSPMQ